jgi:hypothetical protein
VVQVVRNSGADIAIEDDAVNKDDQPGEVSKVMDENGEPLVVYRDTLDEFADFDRIHVNASSAMLLPCRAPIGLWIAQCVNVTIKTMFHWDGKPRDSARTEGNRLGLGERPICVAYAGSRSVNDKGRMLQRNERERAALLGRSGRRLGAPRFSRNTPTADSLTTGKAAQPPVIHHQRPALGIDDFGNCVGIDALERTAYKVLDFR